MKNFLLILCLMIGFISNAQIHNQLRARQVIVDSSITLRKLRADSIRLDTANWLGDVHSPAMVDAIYKFVKGRVDNINVTVVGCEKRLTSPYSIVWAGTNFDWVVSAGTYSIDCNNYSNASTPVSLAAADPSNDRTDVIYLDATGVHVLTGVVAPPGTSIKPLVQGDQIELTSILVSAGAATPTLTEVVIYDENTESVVTNVGTTTNADYLTNPYHLTKSVLIGTLTNNDYIIFTKASGSWDFLNIDAMTFFIKLNAVMAGSDNIRVALYNGTQQVSSEIVVAMDKLNTTSWQGVSISKATFGTLLNSLVTSVRFRATIATSSTAAPQIDYIKTVSGIINPPGSGTITASEGLTMETNDVRLGGFLGNPAKFTSDRYINTNRQSAIWQNGTIPDMTEIGGATWDFGQETFSPFQFISRDTLLSNDIDPPSKAVPWSGVYARRELFYADGIIRTQKVFGHDFKMKFNFKDSMSFNTQSGDYNNGFKTLLEIHGRGTGRNGARASHGTNQNLSRAYGVYSSVSTLLTTNEGSGSYVRINGHTGSYNAYLVMNTNDSIMGGHVYYGTGSFIGGTNYIAKSYVLAPSNHNAKPQIDSAFFLFDTSRVERTYHAGNMVIGASRGTANAWASSDTLKVLGNFAVTDSVRIGKARSQTDTTGYDIVLRQRTDGSIFAIRADLLSTFLSSATGGIDDVLAVGQVLTTDREIDMSSHTLYVHGNDATQGTIFENTGSGFALAATSYGNNFALVTTTLGNQAPIHAHANNISNGNILLEMENSRTNIVKPIIISRSHTANNADSIAANGFGTAYDSYLENGAEIEKRSSRIITTLTDVTNGSEDSKVEVWGLINGVETLFNTFDGSGGGGGEATSIGSFQTTSTANGLSLSGTDVRLHAASATNPGGIIVGSGLSIDGSGVLSATGGIASLSAIGSSPNANGATITGTVLNLQPASDLFGGVVTTGTQTFAGTKFFNSYTQHEVGLSLKENNIGSSAASGYVWLYAKTDGLIYGRDDAGVETKLSNDVGGGGSGTVNAGTANTLAYYPASSTTVDDLAAITANRALISDANGLPTHATTTATEIGYVNGVTSAIQTQIDSKEPVAYDVYVRSDETLANSNADQDLFTNSAHNTFTVTANTTYEFEAVFDLTHGAVSHSVAFGMTPTTATVSNIEWTSFLWVTAVGTTTASQNSTRGKTTSTIAINSAGANATESVTVKGSFTIGATGGTITPQIKFSADPTGTVLLKAGSRFRITPIGNNTFTEESPWN